MYYVYLYTPEIGEIPTFVPLTLGLLFIYLTVEINAYYVNKYSALNLNIWYLIK